jgi:Uma2 family endonuclease
VEVLSSNRSHDRLTKRVVYGEAGVRAYWMVDPSGSVEHWTGSPLSVRADPSTHLVAGVLPGFSLELQELFAAP